MMAGDEEKQIKSLKSMMDSMDYIKYFEEKCNVLENGRGTILKNTNRKQFDIEAAEYKRSLISSFNGQILALKRKLNKKIYK